MLQLARIAGKLLGGESIGAKVGEGNEQKTQRKHRGVQPPVFMAEVVMHHIFDQNPHRFHQDVEQDDQADIGKEFPDIEKR